MQEYSYIPYIPTKIAKIFTHTNTFLDYLRNALLIHEVPRFDIHGKNLLETICKYYFSDHSLRNLLCGFNLRRSIEKVIENVIYLHLLQRGYKVTVEILRAGEIDFVAEKAPNVFTCSQPISLHQKKPSKESLEIWKP